MDKWTFLKRRTTNGQQHMKKLATYIAIKEMQIKKDTDTSPQRWFSNARVKWHLPGLRYA
jgi:ferritin